MKRFFFLGPTALTLLASPLHAALEPAGLRVLSMENPEGIDETPSLSWRLQSGDKGARQSAYRILIASTRDALMKDEGDLWDTGKIQSSESLYLPYAGKALPSTAGAFWKVQVWNEKDEPSAWSAPAHWSMGLLDKSEWKAQWIGLDDVERDAATPDRILGGAVDPLVER